MPASRAGPWGGFPRHIRRGGGRVEGSATEGPSASATAPRKGMLDRPLLDMLLVDAMLLLILSLVVFSGGNLAGLVLYLPIAIPGILGPLLVLWRGKGWAYLLSAIGLLLLPLLLLSYSPGSVADPLRGPEFVASAMMVLSAALGVPAGIAGFRGAKRGAAKVSARDGLRTRWGIAAVLVTGLLFGAMLGSTGAWMVAISSAGTSSDIAPEATVTLAAENYLFAPTNITVPAGKVTEIVVVNKDTAYHTFTYTLNGTTYSHAVLGSSTTKFLVFFAAPASVRFWCIPHESMGMTGTMNIA